MSIKNTDNFLAESCSWPVLDHKLTGQRSLNNRVLNPGGVAVGGGAHVGVGHNGRHGALLQPDDAVVTQLQCQRDHVNAKMARKSGLQRLEAAVRDRKVELGLGGGAVVLVYDPARVDVGL